MASVERRHENRGYQIERRGPVGRVFRHTIGHLETRVIQTSLGGDIILNDVDKTAVAMAVPDISVRGVVAAKDGCLCEVSVTRGGVETGRIVPRTLVQLVSEGTRTKDLMDIIERVERITAENQTGELMDIDSIVFTDEKIPPTTVELSPEEAKGVLLEMSHYPARTVAEPTSFIKNMEWVQSVHKPQGALQENVEVSLDRPNQAA